MKSVSNKLNDIIYDKARRNLLDKVSPIVYDTVWDQCRTTVFRVILTIIREVYNA